jgi:hypothetical protein
MKSAKPLLLQVVSGKANKSHLPKMMVKREGVLDAKPLHHDFGCTVRE